MALKASRSSVGERLHRARTGRGLSLDRVAEDTKIDRSCLEALERDLPPHDHHRGIYARIFLREYARYLGLNAKPLVETYRITHPQPDRPLIGGPAPIERRPSRWLARGLVGASIVTLAVLTAINVRQDIPQEEGIGGVPLRRTVPRPAAPASPPPASPSSAEEPRGIRLVLRVTDAPAWVRVIRGDRVLLEETLEPGSVQRFRAPRRLGFVLGNAGAVRLEANGEPLLVPSDSGQVYVGTVALRGARVVLAPA
jgi:transcriptional regulator with XRE-family HTH domain